MSGGVDSSVAAMLLQEQGHEVVGVFMRNGVAGKSAQEKSCCSASDARDAAVVADRLGMAFYAVDYQEEFASAVISGDLWAVQFHPEKSQDSGLQLIRNFLAL